MKLNIIILISFIFKLSPSFGQSTLIVDYTHSIHIEGLPSETVINATLIANKDYSVYEMDFMNNKSFINEDNGEQGAVFSIKPTQNPIIYKENNTRVIYSTEMILTPFLVKDSYNAFKWEFTKNEKTILNYKCQEALINYGGRNYVAYFTTDVPFNSAPWKFTNLPGVILEIKSTDNVFHIVANKLQVKNNKSVIKFPFKEPKEKAITRNDFIEKYKQKYEELTHYRSESGGTMSLPKRKIEVLIED